jgi:hypothetical protein
VPGTIDGAIDRALRWCGPIEYDSLHRHQHRRLMEGEADEAHAHQDKQNCRVTYALHYCWFQFIFRLWLWL